MKSTLLVTGVFISIMVHPFSQAAELPSQETSMYGAAAANAVAQIKKQMETVHALLTQICDNSSASVLAPQIENALNEIKKIDISSFAEEDEECLAAEFTEAFTAIIAEVDRLVKAKLYHDPVLNKLFGHYMESQDEGTMPAQLTPIAEYKMLTE